MKDGRRIVSGSKDESLKIWDLVTLQCCVTLKGHSNAIWRVAVASDDSFIVSASKDDTLKVSGTVHHPLRDWRFSTSQAASWREFKLLLLWTLNKSCDKCCVVQCLDFFVLFIKQEEFAGFLCISCHCCLCYSWKQSRCKQT